MENFYDIDAAAILEDILNMEIQKSFYVNTKYTGIFEYKSTQIVEMEETMKSGQLHGKWRQVFVYGLTTKGFNFNNKNYGAQMELKIII